MPAKMTFAKMVAQIWYITMESTCLNWQVIDFQDSSIFFIDKHVFSYLPS